MQCQRKVPRSPEDATGSINLANTRQEGWTAISASLCSMRGKCTMANSVEGQELGTKQTVNSIETVHSDNLKDRRRHNDDSKHQDKVRRHSAMWARKKAANDMLMDPAHRDPLNHYH